jgi:hypothetical protein
MDTKLHTLKNLCRVHLLMIGVLAVVAGLMLFLVVSHVGPVNCTNGFTCGWIGYEKPSHLNAARCSSIAACFNQASVLSSPFLVFLSLLCLYNSHRIHCFLYYLSTCVEFSTPFRKTYRQMQLILGIVV